ncbi:hypothetical protein DFJ74DRAFT_685703 [Hyaloraphidium curvatum]|nr:hypothetical protein DFJ74DRAFT_685703 [Hyaloraphidium curvatum]
MNGLATKGLGKNFLLNGGAEYSHVGALCRWLRLVGRVKSPEAGIAASSLVRHVPGDLSCPCVSCCSWVESASGMLDFLDILGNVSIPWATFFLLAYTPVVTFGAGIWSTWYGILLGAIWTFFFPAQLLLSISRLLAVDNMAHLALERRLHCRAVDNAMGDLLGRFRRAAAAGDVPPRSRSWLYVRLHYHFAALCRFRRHQDSLVLSRLFGLALIPGLALLTALYAVSIAPSRYSRTRTLTAPRAPSAGGRPLHLRMAARLLRSRRSVLYRQRRQPRRAPLAHRRRRGRLPRRAAGAPRARPPHRAGTPGGRDRAARSGHSVVPGRRQVQGEAVRVRGVVRDGEDDAGDGPDGHRGTWERAAGFRGDGDPGELLSCNGLSGEVAAVKV